MKLNEIQPIINQNWDWGLKGIKAIEMWGLKWRFIW